MNVFVVILDHEGVKAAKEVSARLQHALPELFELSEGVFVVAGDMLTETVAQAAGLKGEDRIAEATGAVFKVGPYEKLAKAPPSNVTLPPIDAEPEEIAQALFQRPQLKKPSAEDAGESQRCVLNAGTSSKAMDGMASTLIGGTSMKPPCLTKRLGLCFVTASTRLSRQLLFKLTQRPPDSAA